MDEELEGFRQRALERRVARYEEFLSPTTDPFALGLVEEVPAGAGGLAVDAGCGPGRLLPHLRARGYHVVGVDVAEHMLRRARHRDPAVPLLVGNAEALPIADATVDLLVWAFLVPHVTSLERALREARRVLRPNGWFACVTWSTPEESVLTGLLFNLVRRHPSLPWDLAPLMQSLAGRPEVLATAVAEAGMTVQSVRDSRAVRRLPGADDWWTGLISSTVGLSELLEVFTLEERRSLRERFGAEAARFRSGEDGLAIPVVARQLLARRD